MTKKMKQQQDVRKEPELQGEGNYDAARRHRKGAEEFTATHDTERIAREAASTSKEEEHELLDAEQEGRSKAR
jgi:hypothetical protein